MRTTEPFVPISEDVIFKMLSLASLKPHFERVVASLAAASRSVWSFFEK